MTALLTAHKSVPAAVISADVSATLALNSSLLSGFAVVSVVLSPLTVVVVSDLLSSSLLQAPANKAKVATTATPQMRRQLLCGFIRTPLSPCGQSAIGAITLSVLLAPCGHIRQKQ
jgi:hypothetical protein